MSEAGWARAHAACPAAALLAVLPCLRARLHGGAQLGRHQAALLRCGEPGRRADVAPAAGSCAGLYPAAWSLPLQRPAVDAAQAAQHTAQRPAGGFGAAHVGLQLEHFWGGDNRWYEATVTAYCPR